LFTLDGGWLAAAKAINAIGLFAKGQGVQFKFGECDLPGLANNFGPFTHAPIVLALSRSPYSPKMKSPVMVLKLSTAPDISRTRSLWLPGRGRRH
jgi:hypothetical protein